MPLNTFVPTSTQLSGYMGSAGTGQGLGSAIGAAYGPRQSAANTGYLGAAANFNTGAAMGSSTQTQNPTSNMNMGQGTPIVGWLTSLAKDIVTAARHDKESPASKVAKHRFQGLREPVAQLFQRTFFNPVMQQYTQDVSQAFNEGRTRDPYATVPHGANTAAEAYKWDPSQAMQGIYSGFLGRNYGLPENIARAQAAQAMGAVRLGELPEGVTSAAGMSQALSQAQGRMPQAYAGAQAGQIAPEMVREMDYLRGAAELSAFNMQRARKLPQLIG